jgi:hypothetical protein
MITALIIILSLYSLGATVALVRQVKQNVELEEALINVLDRVSVTLKLMRQLDDRQLFEADDEVGEVFAQLVEVTNDFLDMEKDVVNDD